jgi:hypothetical protein
MEVKHCLEAILACIHQCDDEYGVRLNVQDFKHDRIYPWALHKITPTPYKTGFDIQFENRQTFKIKTFVVHIQSVVELEGSNRGYYDQDDGPGRE